VVLPLSVGSRGNSLVAEAPVYFEDNFSKEDLEEWHELHPQLERGRQQTFTEYIHGQNKRAAIRQEITGVLTQVDVIAMPTGSTIGDKAEAVTAVIRGRELPARSRAVYLNGMASQAGVPALSVLCGFAKEGRFPVGLQLIGRDLDEALLYRVAYSYEQATEWHMRHPPL
jgi:aspartyl-tRNA(Asn)/glutamyl-tRNA(Gln) amidotransferase subunit A